MTRTLAYAKNKSENTARTKRNLPSASAYAQTKHAKSSRTKPKFLRIDIFRTIFTLPLKFYALLLIFLPLAYIFLLSFLTADGLGGYTFHFTLKNYLDLFDPVYLKTIFSSLWIGLLTTLLCLLISYPFAIFLRDKKEKTRETLIRLVMLPFLTNSMIRTYGWITLLRKHGAINSALLGLGLTSAPLSLLYNNFALVIGMVYTLLPFMILPVSSAVEKVDQSYLDAASDLGAGKLRRFFRIYLPLTLPGAFNGSLMVFIPAIGYFFIADILGGGKLMIIGNLIKNQFLASRNWPLGAAFSVVLLGLTFLLVKLYQKIGGSLDDLGT